MTKKCKSLNKEMEVEQKKCKNRSKHCNTPSKRNDQKGNQKHANLRPKNMQVIDSKNANHEVIYLKNASHPTRTGKLSTQKMQVIDQKKCKSSTKNMTVIELKMRVINQKPCVIDLKMQVIEQRNGSHQQKKCKNRSKHCHTPRKRSQPKTCKS